MDDGSILGSRNDISDINILFFSFHSALVLLGFMIIGFGCAPIYPCIIHMTPDVFGKDRSQSMVGVQMAFAYVWLFAYAAFVRLDRGEYFNLTFARISVNFSCVDVCDAWFVIKKHAVDHTP